MSTAATIRAARQVRYATAIPQNAFIGAGGRGASAVAWKRSPIDGGAAQPAGFRWPCDCFRVTGSLRPTRPSASDISSVPRRIHDSDRLIETLSTTKA